jgi:hypothetical protein
MDRLNLQASPTEEQQNKNTNSIWRRIETRLAIYSLIFFLMFVFLFLLSLIRVTYASSAKGNLLGVDFADYYAAGKMVIAGDIAHVYNVPAHHAVLEQVLGKPTSLTLPWRYPPIFLLLIVPFALLPFQAALVAWLFTTLALALYCAYRMIPKRKIIALLFLGFPGMYMNLLWGQNGFLSAALLALGVGFIECNPVLSGAMFGLLLYKPQFAVFLLLLLLLTKRWKALVSAVISALLVSLVSLIVFGPDTWLHFAQSFFGSTENLLATDRASIATIQLSPFNSMLILGTSVMGAILSQAIVSMLASIAVVWVWKHSKNTPLLGAMLVLGIPLAIPYFMQYDLMILAVPLILLVYDFLERGSTKLERATLILLWLLPLINWPLAILTAVQIAPVVIIALAVMVVLRVKKENHSVMIAQT